MAKFKCEYSDQKTVCDSLRFGNCNDCPICHRLREIHSRNVRELDLDLQIGPMSIVDNRKAVCNFVVAIITFVLLSSLQDIHSRNIASPSP